MAESLLKRLSGSLDDVCEFIKIDYYIMVADTDKRSFSGYEILNNKNAIIGNIIVFDYTLQRPPKDSEIEKDYYRLKNQPNVQYVRCEKDGDDCQYLSKLDIGKDSTVWIDISSMIVPCIFKVFYVLNKIKRLSSLDVIYSEPKYYDFFNGIYFDYDKDMVSREYKALTEYYISTASKEVALVCYLGFERMVSKYVHESNEHSETIAINGFPSFIPKIKDISLEHNYELISAIGLDQVKYVKANDPFASYNVLCSIAEQKQYCIVGICVWGSKPMALGACIFALKHQNIAKVSYPFAIEPQKHSSKEISKTWWYTFDI